jgi:hypothetical protein
VDSHGSAFNLTPADSTTGTPAVHGIPFYRSPDPALFMDLCSAGSLVNHHEKFLCKERPEPLFYVIRTQGDHVIAENFVNRNIGDNLFIEIDKSRKNFTQKG